MSLRGHLIDCVMLTMDSMIRRSWGWSRCWGLRVFLESTRDRTVLTGHGILVLAGQSTLERHIFHVDTLAAMDRTKGSIGIDEVNESISRYNSRGVGTTVTLDDDVANVSKLNEHRFQVLLRHFQIQLWTTEVDQTKDVAQIQSDQNLHHAKQN